MSRSAGLQLHLYKRCLRKSFTKPQCRRHISTSRASPGVPYTETEEAYKIPIEGLSYHWDTTPPSIHQMKHAAMFFQNQQPKFLWSAEKFKTMDFGHDDSPEVCFLGRSNVGKSSLMNALLCCKVARTSSKPGRTKLMNAFAVGSPENRGQNRLVVLDMPGYGKGGRAEWGTQIMKYLEKRRQLKRAFLLVDTEHGVKQSDKQMLALFKQMGVPYQVVLSKADKIMFPTKRDKMRKPNPDVVERRLTELRQAMEAAKEAVQLDTEEDGMAIGEVISVSSTHWVNGHRMGMNALRFAMLRAAGLELKEARKPPRPMEIIRHEDLFGPIPHFD